jgi:hypothetical protein
MSLGDDVRSNVAKSCAEVLTKCGISDCGWTVTYFEGQVWSINVYVMDWSFL